MSIKNSQSLLKWKGCDYNGSEYKINIGTFYWWGPTATHPRLPVQFTMTVSVAFLAGPSILFTAVIHVKVLVLVSIYSVSSCNKDTNSANSIKHPILTTDQLHSDNSHYVKSQR